MQNTAKANAHATSDGTLFHFTIIYHRCTSLALAKLYSRFQQLKKITTARSIGMRRISPFSYVPKSCMEYHFEIFLIFLLRSFGR